MDIKFIQDWISKHCLSAEEITIRKEKTSKQLDDFLKSQEGVILDSSNNQIVFKESDFPDTETFAAALVHYSIAKEVAVIYAKPEAQDGSIIPQFTLKLK